MNISLSLESLKHWGVKGGLGVIDQALYSGVNFLINILIARWVSPEIYGAYSASYSLFLLISIAQVALIAEPMSIFGAERERIIKIPYLNYLLRLQWIGSLVVAIIFFVISFFLPDHDLRNAMLAMSGTFPFILLYWYLRRAFYIEMESGLAMWTSFMYAAFLLLFILLVQRLGHVNSVTVYFVMALSSLIASIFAAKRLGLKLLGSDKAGIGFEAAAVNQELWDFGKWILLAYLAGWFTSLSFPFFITILIDAKSAGGFRVLQNLFLPFQQLLASITLLVLPWLARQNSEYGKAKLFSITHLTALLTGVFALLYCSFVIIFRHPIISFLYANDFYLSFERLSIALAISTLLGSAPLILGLALRVLGKPNIILLSKGYAAFFLLVFGLPIIWMFQINGVLFSIIGSVVIEVSILLIYYVHTFVIVN